MKVSDYMSSPVHAVNMRDSVATARNLMIRHRVGRLVVVDDEMNVVGILSKSDFSIKLYRTMPKWKNRPLNNVPVNVIMSPEPVTVSPDIDIPRVASLMLENDIGSLPVVDDGGVIGIITKTDIVRYYLENGKDRKIDDLISEIPSVHKYHSIFHVIELLNELDAHRVVVVDDDRTPLGVITHSDIAFTSAFETGETRLVDMGRKKHDGTQSRTMKRFFLVAGDIMSHPVISVTPDSTLRETAKVILDRNIDGVVVLDGKNVLGQISKIDILKVVSEGS